MSNLVKRYKKFIDNGKTERECVNQTIVLAEEKGYKDIFSIKAPLKAGDKVYYNQMGKSIVLFHLGTEELEKGMNILGAHVDSPRLDIKQNPLYEKNELVYLDTHYYGGIKKFQWVTLPLALHGVVCKKDGTTVNIIIGEDDDDPVFYISDILPHLGQEQAKEIAGNFIHGEDLDLLVGLAPFKKEAHDDDDDDEKKKNIGKKTVLKLLNDKYGIEEDDFLSAELEVVPAGKSHDVGFDRSMILGYGHDDRCCAFTSLDAILEGKTEGRTSVCILTDKEEIGSVGATGMDSNFFENAVSELLSATGKFDALVLRRCLRNSMMLSSDVSAALDPFFTSLFEEKNTAKLGHGVVFNKFTGSRGKSGSNDANPEYFAKIRNLLDKAGVNFQTAELGKVDQGGGGTIAMFSAKYNMNVIDSGVAVLAMHAPWEIISSYDLQSAKDCYKAFLTLK
ncbi:MAG: aminopeptidase [Sphaerochaetaceae bacterium]